MKGSEIVNLVIVKLEEKSAFLDGSQGPILSGGDSLDELKPVYSYIDEHLSQAADEVLVVAPLHRLSPHKVTDIDQGELPNGVVKVLLPTDFLRLHTFKMKEWERPVHAVVTASSLLYNAQYNKYTMGTPQKPVITYTGEDDSGDLFLMCYSVEEDHTIEDFRYIRRFGLNEVYEYDLAEAIALNCAKKVYEVYGNADMANVMQNELNTVLTNMQM